jgi:hypothetical protein
MRGERERERDLNSIFDAKPEGLPHTHKTTCYQPPQPPQPPQPTKYIYVYIYTYIYIYTHTHTYIYIYTYISGNCCDHRCIPTRKVSCAVRVHCVSWAGGSGYGGGPAATPAAKSSSMPVPAATPLPPPRPSLPLLLLRPQRPLRPPLPPLS